MVGHKLGLAQSNVNHRFYDGLGVTRNGIEAVGDGADLHAVKLGVDRRPCARHSRRGDRRFSEIPSAKHHDSILFVFRPTAQCEMRSMDHLNRV
jgi:hypothetical protein